MAVLSGRLPEIAEQIAACRRCPRLVQWREEVGRVRRAAYRNQSYWSRPVAGFGDPAARLLLIGLAPGAHGANRTGRPFTGDASGRFLYPALYRCGLSNRAESLHPGDGLELRGIWITSAVRCVPPGNLPTREELANCADWTVQELADLPIRVFLALGQIAHDALLAYLGLRPSQHRFGHGQRWSLSENRWLVDSYHVSARNTQTGRLTAPMFDALLSQAVHLADLDPPEP
jgi:uracil-DNA glycosylase family 4